MQTLVVQQVLLQDCLLTGQLLLCHLLQRDRDRQLIIGQLVVSITELTASVILKCLMQCVINCIISASHLDVIRPAVLLSLPFDPALDQLQCFLSGGPWTFDLPRCITGTLIQCGAEALGQGVTARTSLGAELALCAVFGV